MSFIILIKSKVSSYSAISCYLKSGCYTAYVLFIFLDKWKHELNKVAWWQSLEQNTYEKWKQDRVGAWEHWCVAGPQTRVMGWAGMPSSVSV